MRFLLLLLKSVKESSCFLKNFVVPGKRTLLHRNSFKRSVNGSVKLVHFTVDKAQLL